jgi:hypothetical protein
MSAINDIANQFSRLRGALSTGLLILTAWVNWEETSGARHQALCVALARTPDMARRRR